jgi:hypothetical protein
VLGWDEADTTPPIVSSTNPAADATEVAINTAIIATFSEPMEPSMISTATFTVLDGTTPVPGTVLYVGLTALFAPEFNLDPNTEYRATVKSGVQDLAGNAMIADYAWTFSTGSDWDAIRPRVVATNPVNDATDVAVRASVIAVFSEAMDPTTITTATFTLLDGSTPVPGTVSYVGVTAVFTPADDLAPLTIYSARIASGVKDMAGNEMVADYAWSFTSGGYIDETAPSVIATNPVDEATEVAVNASVIAIFSEAMDPTTISTDTFTVFVGSIPVFGTVNYLGVTAVFMPAVDMAPLTVYSARIASGVKDLAGNEMLVDHAWSFTSGGEVDETAPRVIATNPVDEATDVAVNASVIAVFSEAMDPTTISTATFTVFVGEIPVFGTMDYVGVTAVFTPAVNLAPLSVYSARIASGVKDLAGNEMVADYAWSFTSGGEVDETAPRVIATNPVDEATDVAVNASVIAVFSEAMDPTTISTATFTVFAGEMPVLGTVNYAGVTAVFNPLGILDDDTLYTARISNVATDLAGNPLASDYVFSFTTGLARDTTAPEVDYTIPENGDIDVELDAAIIAVFSEAMDPTTISTATFMVFVGSVPVFGTVDYVGVTAVFTPAVAMAPLADYNATITAEVKDLAGNAMLAPYIWTFTTGPMPDILRPRVTFTVPTDDATGVVLDGNIAAVFSEAMDPATISAANFTVQQLGQYVLGTVDYADVTAVFSPISPLAPNTIYSATITTAVQDLAGNSLAQNYVWNFKTGITIDSTRPMVISTNPMDEAIDVVLDTDVSATFNEVMDPLSLNDQTFTLMDGAELIPGTVVQIGANMSFDPTDNLSFDTEYTATITTGATDLAGNALVEDYVWTFTTGMALDDIPPTVVMTNPLDLATFVPIDTTVNATFSEAMRPLSISTATFTVTGPGIVEVIGMVQYDPMGMIGTFTPQSDLLPETTYTATISTGAMDLAGNGMEEDYVWTFSTGVTPSGMLPVDLGSLSTFVAVAGAGLTNSNSSGITTLNGDVGLSPTGTCLGDGSPCTITNPVINGTLYVNDPEGVAAQAKVDLTAAYVDAMSRPVGTTVNDITGMVLAPGVYTSMSTMSIAVGGTVTLDGKGDANAVWIFQVGSSLTVNNNAQILLINGAKAKNVFWACFASSTLGSEVNFKGSVLAGASNSVGTDSVVVGRLLCTTGEITLLSNTITLPPD